jgi:TAT (twin-arginine translocation) pathway signal sequence
MSNTYEANNTRRDFLKTSATAVAGLSYLGLGLKAQPLVFNRALEDDKNTHNMMLVGTKTAYLSHLVLLSSIVGGISIKN